MRLAPSAAVPHRTRIAAALAVFAKAFDDLESRGIVVRDFPKANDANMLVFGYIIDAIRTAATREKIECSRVDNAPLARRIAAVLEWEGHPEGAAILEGAASRFADRSYDEDDRRLVHMWRWLGHALGFVEEMNTKGILPADWMLADLRETHRLAVDGIDLDTAFLKPREFAGYMASRLATSGYGEASASAARYAV